MYYFFIIIMIASITYYYTIDTLILGIPYKLVGRQTSRYSTKASWVLNLSNLSDVSNLFN